MQPPALTSSSHSITLLPSCCAPCAAALERDDSRQSPCRNHARRRAIFLSRRRGGLPGSARQDRFYSRSARPRRALGEHLATQGYTVFGPRLTHHGTAPAELNRSRWWDWYFSALDGWHILNALCKKIAAVGLSMGGAMARRGRIHVCAALPHVRVPTLLLHSRADRVVAPENMDLICQARGHIHRRPYTVTQRSREPSLAARD